MINDKITTRLFLSLCWMPARITFSVVVIRYSRQKNCRSADRQKYIKSNVYNPVYNRLYNAMLAETGLRWKLFFTGVCHRAKFGPESERAWGKPWSAGWRASPVLRQVCGNEKQLYHTGITGDFILLINFIFKFHYYHFCFTERKIKTMPLCKNND